MALIPNTLVCEGPPFSCACMYVKLLKYSANTERQENKEMKKIHRCTTIVMTVILLLSVGATTSLLPSNAQVTTLPRDQTLYLYIDGGKKSNPYAYNPFLADWIGSAGHHQLMIEFMSYYSLSYTANYTLWLATSIESTSDFKNWTITLRQGVKWNDGVDFTANDVAFTYNMLLTPHTPPLAYESSVQEQIKSVEVVDNYTIKINLKTPNPRFYASELVGAAGWSGLAIVPEHIWKDKDPTTYDGSDNVWTGPYKLISVAATGDRFVYERDDNWWGTKVLGIRPGPKYVVYVSYATAEATSLQLLTDQLDYGDLSDRYTFESLRDKNPFLRAFNLTLPYAFPTWEDLRLAINCARYPWNNPEVRKALSYYINRSALDEISQGGVAPPAAGPIGPLVSQEYKEIENALAAKYNVLEYNVSKGDEILTSLGWTKGTDGVWITENGTRVTFSLFVFVGWGTFLEYYGRQLVDQLRTAGIDCTALALSGTAMTDAWLGSTWDGCSDWAGGGAANEPYPQLEYYLSKYIVPEGQPAPGNIEKWNNSTFDAIINQMLVISPYDPHYLDLVAQALEIFYQQMPDISTIMCNQIASFSTKYWTGWSTAENYYVSPFINAFACCHIIYLELQPTNIPTVTVYWTKDTTQFRPSGTFRGIDHVWYGPFERGDAAIIPVDDAEYWVRIGYASYTPPITIPVEELLATISDLNTRVDNMETTINSLTTEVSSLSSQLSMLTILAGVALTIAIVSLAVGFLRRKS